MSAVGEDVYAERRDVDRAGCGWRVPLWCMPHCCRSFCLKEAPGVDEDAISISWDMQDQACEPTTEEVKQYKGLRQVLSLEDNCLDCITKNFDRFNNAYLSSEDPVLRRNLGFLQRVHFSHVTDSHVNDRLLKDGYLDFVISEYLKELDLIKFLYGGCTLKAIEKRIVHVGNCLTKVYFKFPYQVTEESIRQFLNATICHLSNVEVLHILENCNDTTLKNISSFCTKLTELNIDKSSKVTFKGLKMLCKKQSEEQTECLIKILSLGDIKVLDSAVTFLLKNMPYLEILDCINLPSILHSMHEKDLKNNTLNSVKKYNLTKLDFLYSGRTLKLNMEEGDSKVGALQVWTEVCPNIKSVYINVSTENCLDLVSRFANLENLTVGVAKNITSANNNEFNIFLESNGFKLKDLSLHRTVLSVTILIESCPNLQKLFIWDVKFQSIEKNLTEGQPSYKNNLHSLTELSIRHITFSDPYAEDSVNNILLSSPNLRKLSFCTCWFQDTEMNNKIAKFCENSALQHFSIGHTYIRIDLLKSILLNCSSLLSLSIDSCDVNRDIGSLYKLRDTVRSSVKINYNMSFEEFLHQPRV